MNEVERAIKRNWWLYSFVFLLAASGPCCGSQLPAVSPKESPLWIAGNNSIEIGVNRSTGLIEHLLDKVSHEDYCNQNVKNATSDTDGNQGLHFIVGIRPGGLKLLDELRGQEYSDLEHPGVVSNLKESNSGGVASLTYDKQYPGAEFVVTETFSVSATQIRWDVKVKKSSGLDRTVRVINLLPMPLGGYQAWAPISDAPFQVKPWLPFSIDYGQSTAGAIGEGRWRATVPLMVFYSEREHRALAVDGFDTNKEVIARLPDAANIGSVEVYSVDSGDRSVQELHRDGDKLTITVPKHGKATVILLRPKG